ncbi:helix-turn-helix domain-containing protein [Plantactinospora soyae]|uniref:Transcriptional regulator with XRE-family HTH domain n=1 Tax=Plantactinospora soyae TaxID=1544732 RepID=A0A927MIY4_9ACTN|nr:helix-turn-helix transcriptional regulator [Plantactinospora soyae]MBE1492025.1 transcriptional regulator with XRE-family HTH domain [Plantactinospora soyae]
MARFTPATPRSRRLGRELRRLRDAARLTLEEAGKRIGSSGSRIQRIESGDIKVRPGDVMELLVAYGVAIDGEPGESLLVMARELREAGWWQRLDALPSRYATMIAYEEEAAQIHNFEPVLIPGLLQTEAYARAVISVGQEMNAQAIDQRVQARMTRQAILTRKDHYPKLDVVVAEAALMVEVGGTEVMREQLDHLAEVSRQTNITIRMLRFAAGAHMANHGGFLILESLNDPPLGYIDTLAGALFLESPNETNRLTVVYNHLKELAMSPAESVKFIKERSRAMA